MDRTRPDHGPLRRGYARVVVALRWPIAVGWVLAAMLAWVLLPGLGGSGASPLDDVVPKQSRALDAQQRALEIFGSTPNSDVMVVARDPDGLSAKAILSIAQRAVAVGVVAERVPFIALRGALPVVNQPLPDVTWGEERTTAITYLFVDPEANLQERAAIARTYARHLRESLGPGVDVGVTGPAPARLAQFEEIEDALPIVELATLAVILLVVSLYFRSIGAPLVTLGAAAIAYVIAVRTLGWVGEAAGIAVPAEIEPLLVVLLLGLVTDYGVFFLAEGRRRLMAGEPRLDAARAATARIGPMVCAAGLMVAACTTALLVGKLEFFRVFGPGLALCALVVTVVSLTLVPAVLALLGPRLFGRSTQRDVSRFDAAQRRETETRPGVRAPAVPGGASMSTRRRERRRMRLAGLLGTIRAARRAGTRSALTARILATRPVAALLVLVAVGALGWSATHARHIELGVSFIAGLPSDAGPREADADATRGFNAGIVSPTDIILEAPGIGDDPGALTRLQRAVGREAGIAATLGPREQDAVEQFTGTGRLPPVFISENRGAARIVTITNGDPTAAKTIDVFESLERRLPALAAQAGLPRDVRVSYAGESPLAAESVDAVVGDLKRIAVAVTLITLLLLVLFLRALVAPVLLLFAGALGFVAALGLTQLLAGPLLGSEQLTYFVPLVGAVLLIALGSDYNVLIAGRIRDEASRRRLTEAIATAAPQASRAITVAGITLAATFALLGLIALQGFRELALLLAVGVLVDALVVRPVLIPGLFTLVGEATWWPRVVRRTEPFTVLVRRIAGALGTDEETALHTAYATLKTLGERIGDREAAELARHLPAPLAMALADAEGCEPFPYAEFVARVASRAGIDPLRARRDAHGVMTTIAAALPETELDYVRAALSEDYRSLLGDDLPVHGSRPRVPA